MKTMQRLLLGCVCSLIFVALCTTAQAQLIIDFNSTTQDGGPHNNAGYQAYNAGHEVAADFVTQNYSAFGTTVGVTPAWPNTTNNNVQQMIDRAAGNDANWTDTDIDLVTDFLGIDTRTAQGGNGDWNGTTGTPTYMTLTLSGLPASLYEWKSYHHDTEHVHTNFAVWLSTDAGATFAQLPDGYMSDSTPGGTPDSAVDGAPGLVTGFAGMAAAGSIYETGFTADGVNDVVFRFAPFSGVLGSAVHNQLFGINGFELIQGGILGDTDGDGVGGEFPDDFDPIRANFRKSVTSRDMGDLVPNGIVDFDDFRQWKAAHLGGGGSLEGLDLSFAANVPEPGTATLLLLALGALWTRRVRN